VPPSLAKELVLALVLERVPPSRRHAPRRDTVDRLQEEEKETKERKDERREELPAPPPPPSCLDVPGTDRTERRRSGGRCGGRSRARARGPARPPAPPPRRPKATVAERRRSTRRAEPYGAGRAASTELRGRLKGGEGPGSHEPRSTLAEGLTGIERWREPSRPTALLLEAFSSAGRPGDRRTALGRAPGRASSGAKRGRSTSAREREDRASLSAGSITTSTPRSTSASARRPRPTAPTWAWT
jgi:hypothetical protein